MNEMPAGPDLTKGIAVSTIADGSMIPGHVRGEPVLLVRRGNKTLAVAVVHRDSDGLTAEVAFELTR
jgi:hypothetical protein